MKRNNRENKDHTFLAGIKYVFQVLPFVVISKQCLSSPYLPTQLLRMLIRILY